MSSLRSWSRWHPRRRRRIDRWCRHEGCCWRAAEWPTSRSRGVVAWTRIRCAAGVSASPSRNRRSGPDRQGPRTQAQPADGHGGGGAAPDPQRAAAGRVHALEHPGRWPRGWALARTLWPRSGPTTTSSRGRSTRSRSATIPASTRSLSMWLASTSIPKQTAVTAGIRLHKPRWRGGPLPITDGHPYCSLAQQCSGPVERVATAPPSPHRP
jgi:hypothetical protein